MMMVVVVVGGGGCEGVEMQLYSFCNFQTAAGEGVAGWQAGKQASRQVGCSGTSNSTVVLAEC
jgi:hypothetical protein